jgi:hypothetical protein
VGRYEGFGFAWQQQCHCGTCSVCSKGLTAAMPCQPTTVVTTVDCAQKPSCCTLRLLQQPAHGMTATYLVPAGMLNNHTRIMFTEFLLLVRAARLLLQASR